MRGVIELEINCSKVEMDETFNDQEFWKENQEQSPNLAVIFFARQYLCIPAIKAAK